MDGVCDVIELITCKMVQKIDQQMKIHEDRRELAHWGV